MTSYVPALPVFASSRETFPFPDFPLSAFGLSPRERWIGEMTNRLLAELNLTERQREAIRHTRIHGRIANLEYQRLSKVSKPTASRDLEQLRSLGLLAKAVRTGKGYCVPNPKRLTKGSKASARSKG